MTVVAEEADMHVRMTTIRGDASNLQAAVDAAENRARPAIEAAPGNKGFATLTGAGGTFIGASYWDSAQAEAASREALTALREEVAATVGGILAVETYEVAVARRITMPAAGAIVRLLRVEIDPSGLDGAIAHYRDHVLPVFAELPGVCSLQLLVDRTAGKAVGISAWDDEIAIEKAQHAMDEARAEVAKATGAKFSDPERYTLVRTTLQID